MSTCSGLSVGELPPRPSAVMVQGALASQSLTAVKGTCNTADQDNFKNRFNTMITDIQGCIAGCLLRGDSCLVSCGQDLGFTATCSECITEEFKWCATPCVFKCLDPTSE